MNVYVDSSVLLRIVLQQPGADGELLASERRLTSTISEVECLCAVDAARWQGDLDDSQWGDRRAQVYEQLRRMHRVVLTRSVLERAGQPLPVPLRALDAIHLATALSIREQQDERLVFATHDRRQAQVARALGFEVTGV